MVQRLARKVLLIGWDAADWRMIHPMLDAGLLPVLEHLINTGTIGNLATLDPPLSPMLWTSIATGKTADQHGILGFIEPTPDGKAMRPVQSTSRTCKAVWNILNQQGLKSHVIGWWPSHPVEPINGVMVSNHYHRPTAPYGEPWPLREGSVYPKRLEETLAELRVHPGELTAAHILPFVPLALEIDQKKDKRLYGLARVIADATSVHAAATWVMEHEPWDFMAVYFDAIDHFGHGFMKFHPPRKPNVSEKHYEYYNYVMTAGYRFHDMMLRRLLDLAGPGTTVILCSDHGFHPDHLRPGRLPREPAGPAAEHRDYGIFCIKGPGIRKDERIYGASLLDIAPTVLSLFDLPVGRDMQGKPLIDVFEEDVEPVFIETWETVDGNTGMHTKDVRSDPWAEREAMQQLAALGYIEPIAEDLDTQIQQHRRESQFYLARVHLYHSRPVDARPILESLFDEAPDQLRYGMRLAQCYLSLGRVRDARRVTDIVQKEYERQIEAESAKRKQAKGDEKEEIRTGKGGRLGYVAGLDLLQGTLLLAENREEEALEHLLKAEKFEPRLPRLHLRIGDVYVKQNRWADAERAFLKALTIDPDSAEAHHGISIVRLKQKQFEDAAEAALRAIGLRYFFPAAHFHLGEALMRLGYYEQAADAFEVCVAQAPGVKQAHFWLSELYRIHLNDLKKANEHLKFATEHIIEPDP